MRRPEDVAFIRRFVTGTGSFEQAALPSERASSSSGDRPALVALAVLAALGLGGFLLLAEPLRWRAS